MTDSRGRHLLADFYGCTRTVLEDPDRLEALLVEASEAVGSRIVARVFHRFDPQGVTGVLVIEESHLSVHTWPETGYASFDFLTCGNLDPGPALTVLARGLGASRIEELTVRRGAGAPLSAEESTGVPTGALS